MSTPFWADVNNFPRLNRQLQDLITSLRRFAPIGHLAFFQDNVAASQTTVALANGLGAVVDFVMPRNGHVIGVAVYSNDARTAGQLNVFPTVGGTPLAGSAQLDAMNVTKHAQHIPKDLFSFFSAGQRVGAVITTTGAWAPTTADIAVTVLVQFTMEDG